MTWLELPAWLLCALDSSQSANNAGPVILLLIHLECPARSIDLDRLCWTPDDQGGSEKGPLARRVPPQKNHPFRNSESCFGTNGAPSAGLLDNPNWIVQHLPFYVALVNRGTASIPPCKPDDLRCVAFGPRGKFPL